MTKPVQHFCHLGHHGPPLYLWPVYQDHGQAKRARGGQFGNSALPARVFGDDMADAVMAQKGMVGCLVKGAAVDHDAEIGQRQRAFGGIDKPQQVMMHWLGRKRLQRLFANRQKDPRGQIGQRRDGRLNIIDTGPAVIGAGCPRWPLQGDKRRGRSSASGNRIAADRGSKGVGGVDDVADGFVAQIPCQTFRAAKAANAGGQRLGDRRSGASGIGIDGIETLPMQGAGHHSGFGCASQQQDARHG
jgi:hypothetical protein